GIEDLYDNRLDVIVVRNALPGGALAAAGVRLDRNDGDLGWAHPNERMPPEDIQLLGTDVPATPTYQAPRGASLQAYLDSAEHHRSALRNIFAEDFDASAGVQRALESVAGGRPVAVPLTDGRSYVPFTVRRLVDGKQIGPH